jgi:3-dehydroquinate dehydratase-2
LSARRWRIEVLHGVNLDQLGRRGPPYPDITLAQLEQEIARKAEQLGMVTRFFHTNHEGELIERLHTLSDHADAILINPGAWTHYAYAIRDALEIPVSVGRLPALEIHLSDLHSRESWRHVSVIRELCFATVMGRGVDGYADALLMLREKLNEDPS